MLWPSTLLKGQLRAFRFFFYGFPKIRRVVGKKFSHINFMHIPAEKLRLLLYSKSLTTLFTTINKPFNSVTALRSRLTNLTHMRMSKVLCDPEFDTASVKFNNWVINAVSERSSLLHGGINAATLLETKSWRYRSAGSCVNSYRQNFFPATLLILGKP